MQQSTYPPSSVDVRISRWFPCADAGIVQSGVPHFRQKTFLFGAPLEVSSRSYSARLPALSVTSTLHAANLAIYIGSISTLPVCGLNICARTSYVQHTIWLSPPAPLLQCSQKQDSTAMGSDDTVSRTDPQRQLPLYGAVIIDQVPA